MEKSTSDVVVEVVDEFERNNASVGCEEKMRLWFGGEKKGQVLREVGSQKL